MVEVDIILLWENDDENEYTELEAKYGPRDRFKSAIVKSRSSLHLAKLVIRPLSFLISTLFIFPLERSTDEQIDAKETNKPRSSIRRHRARHREITDEFTGHFREGTYHILRR